jgi:hypothetical protein
VVSVCRSKVAGMDRSQRYPTPLSWAARFGTLLTAMFFALGLLLGAVARGWMRVIAVDPEFTVNGTLGIVLGFGFFAFMQSVAALAAQRPWRSWPRRGARLLGAFGLLPLFVAAGAIMAPAVVSAGLAAWHPMWPTVVRGALTLVAVANVVAVSLTITSNFGLSMRSLIGVCGLVLIYGCIVWMAAGTFSRPRPTVPPLVHS